MRNKQDTISKELDSIITYARKFIGEEIDCAMNDNYRAVNLTALIKLKDMIVHVRGRIMEVDDAK
jgi:hypothetical protein